MYNPAIIEMSACADLGEFTIAASVFIGGGFEWDIGVKQFLHSLTEPFYKFLVEVAVIIDTAFSYGQGPALFVAFPYIFQFVNHRHYRIVVVRDIRV